MQEIDQTYEIHAPLARVWQAFVDPAIIEQWGGGPAVMSDHKGDTFRLWGGDIHGTNIDVISGRVLEQNWYSGNDWPSPSRVTFSFDEKDGVTTVHLLHQDVPAHERAAIAEGWKDYYLGPIKQLLESQLP